MGKAYTRYQEQRAQCWMLQVRRKDPTNAWSPTSPQWFCSKAEVQSYIETQIDPLNFIHNEYRVARYVPAEAL